MTYEGEAYVNWITNRKDLIIKYCGTEFFRNKSVLEVGAAHGYFGSYLQSLGATVVCTDYSQANCDYIKEHYPNISVLRQDLSEAWPFTESFDIIVHMGVFYHLPPRKAEQSLRDSCQHANCIIFQSAILENAVDEDGIELAKIIDRPAAPQEDLLELDVISQSRNLASIKFIERIFEEEHMEYTRLAMNRATVLLIANKIKEQYNY